MERRVLRDDPWERIKDLLPGKVTDVGVTAKDNRLFLKAVLWMAGRGRRGGICRRNWAIGTPLSRALHAGPSRVSGVNRP